MARGFKKKSKYINESDKIKLEIDINKRRALQEELNQLKKQLPKTKQLKYNFFTYTRTGKELIDFVDDIKDFKLRDCFKILQDYLINKSNKVFILYGLRRTGKTTLIKQAIYNMSNEDKKHTAFIQINSKDTLANLNKDIRYLESIGYKYLFIDEVTLLEDFIEGAALFSDIFTASGFKIVLSGTDSLGFMFADDEQLYDRNIMLHTTFIPYYEFERVLGIKGIDNYIQYGGTMSLSGIDYNNPFSTVKSINSYVDSAIAGNIQHSLKHYQYGGHFRHLYDLYINNELTSVINRVIEDMNHQFTYEVLTKDFKSNDLSISANNLRHDKNNPNPILDQIDTEKVTNRLKQLLEIKNQNEHHQIEIKEYLALLDLITDIPIENLPVSENKNYRTLFTQPGMRYTIAESLVESLLEDYVFQNISITNRDYILKRILSEIKGRMLEDIVLLETYYKYKTNKNKKVFKLQFSIGEYDMVVADKETLSCEIYEVKYNENIIPDQYKHLINQDKCDLTEFRYGSITKKYVLYRGNTTKLDNGITYLNVEEYLKSLEK